jgi:cation diffusion facilitator family transporter
MPQPDTAPAPDRYRSIRNVLWIVLALNVIVALAKLLYGIFSASVAMEADGVHSLFDGVSNVVGLTGMWFAARPADEEHPYGHVKFETFTAAAIAIMLVIAGYTVGRGAIQHLLGHGPPTEVAVASFVIMVGTLCVNAFVTTWETRAGRRLGSEVLVADARHTLSDVAVSLGVIVSLFLVWLGWEPADGVVALLVAVVIFHTAISVIRGVARTLGDQARLPVSDVVSAASEVGGVVECHSVRTRGLEKHVYVDLHIVVEPGVTVAGGHDIAHEVEDALRARFSEIADVVVHVEPDSQGCADPSEAPAPR